MVIAIIGILVGLLLPAIQAAREAARRTECKNKLRQIGIAIQNHVDVVNIFPTGGDGKFPQIENYVTGGKPNGPAKQGLSWPYQILPYLEQNALHDIVSTAQLQGAIVPLYNCPSRRSPTSVEDVKGIGDAVVLTDYAGATPCTCKTPDCTEYYNPRDSVPLTVQAHSESPVGGNGRSFFQGRHEGGERNDAPRDNSVWDGVFVRTPWRWKFQGTQYELPVNVTPPVRMAQVTDGTSNTLLVGEKYVRSDLYGGGSDSDDRGWSDGWDPDTMRSTCFPPLGDSDPIGFAQPDSETLFGLRTDVWYFGSAHPGTFNAAFVDGSVHTINFDIDVVLFNNLGTRNDGQIIDMSGLN